MVDRIAFYARVDDLDGDVEGVGDDVCSGSAGEEVEDHLASDFADGYAETFWSAMPWSAPKMISWHVDMLGWRVPWSVAICAASRSRRPSEPMGLVLESRACWRVV